MNDEYKEWDEVPTAKPKGKSLWVIAVLFIALLFWSNGRENTRPDLYIVGFDAASSMDADLAYGYASLIADTIISSTGIKAETAPQISSRMKNTPILTGVLSNDRLVVMLMDVKGRMVWTSNPMQARKNITGIITSTVRNAARHLELDMDDDQQLDNYPAGSIKGWLAYVRTKGSYVQLAAGQNIDLMLVKSHVAEMTRALHAYAPAHWLAGQVYEEMGDDDISRTSYMKAIELDPLLASIVPSWVLGF